MAASTTARAESSGPSLGQFIVALVVVTILAGAVGALFAPHPAAGPGAQPSKEAPAAEAAAEPAVAATSNLLDLPPIVTNLGSPQEMWIRLETSMIFDPSQVKHPEALAAEIANDLLAYLRTVAVTQIQGPIGLQNLRQDINERAAIRSNGAVKELVIKTLVIQ
ncbi:MAG TPA: flagellar basal body-associated FliL family protein [Roseiarcus sp.]|nr:flagellar basal body-associated FliL family protein [Roseiarcus sp.]